MNVGICLPCRVLFLFCSGETETGLPRDHLIPSQNMSCPGKAMGPVCTAFTPPPPLCSPQTLRDHIRTSFSKEENWVCVFFPGEKMKGEISNEKHRSLCAEASDSAMNFPMRSDIVKLCFQILHQRHIYRFFLPKFLFVFPTNFFSYQRK